VNLVMMGEALKIPARDVIVAKFLGRIDGSSSSPFFNLQEGPFTFWSINHCCFDGRRGVSVLYTANTCISQGDSQLLERARVRGGVSSSLLF
jgi:hypothetical protein